MGFLFETIHFGGVSTAPIGIIIYGGLMFFIVGFVIIPSIREQYLIGKERAKQEKELTEQQGERLRCVECPHCKKYIHRTFYTSDALRYWAPIYCRKFKIEFSPGQLGLRCQAKDPKKAMREKTNLKSQQTKGKTYKASLFEGGIEYEYRSDE